MENQEKKSRRHKIIEGIEIVSICAIVGVIVYFIMIQNSINSDIKPSELPLEKLNQGYDLVCKPRDSMELCMYNETKRTVINPEAQLHLISKNQSKTVDVFQISSVEKNYCIKEFHTDWNNTASQVQCDSTISFDKTLWTVNYLTDKNGNENIIEFTNGSKKS